MNDRELYCRSMANEARSKARYALLEADRAALHREADEWERSAEEAAREGSADGAPGGPALA